MSCSLAAVVQLFCVLRAVTSLDIDTSDGGYTNLLVTINDSVDYNESIIENIKALFRSSSVFLHRSTSGRVYFKHVIINVPDKWLNVKSARSVPRNAFGRGDVRVGTSSNAHENHPVTKQLKPCGHRGEFIQLSSQFLAELNASTMAKYRNPAYVFVHEWAHYRYGVFDEYGSRDDDEYPLTYCHKNKVKLNSCSEEIRFTARTSTGQKCKIRKNCQFTKDCLLQFFRPMNYAVESSIMFMPYQHHINYFCDDIKKNRKHNSFAPNKQNRFCDGMSAWEVIRQNEDFMQLPRPNMTKSVETTFEVVIRESDLHPVVVLVLDVSGSMFMYHRLDYLKEAAERYIREIPDNSVQLAIIVFESTARIACCLKPVNKRTREVFIEAIQKLTYLDGTCIGCGLDLALTIVPNNSREGAAFVLMSDGEHNTDASVPSVKHKLVEAKVKVTTIALEPTADNQLEEIALATGGKAYKFHDLQGRTIADIEAALVDATTAELDDRVVIMRQERDFNFPKDVNFLVDDMVGDSTTVHIRHMDRDKTVVTAWLTDPHGVPCDVCFVDRTWLSTTITIPDVAKAGNWTLHMKSPSSSPVGLHVEVKSRARSAKEVPIMLACEVSEPLVRVPDLVIYAHLKKGDKVVLHADVVAEVLGPNPPHFSTTRLHDDGNYPDITANDGTYSEYFTAYTGRGKYTVVARAKNNNKTTVAVDPFPSFGGNPDPTVLQANDETGNPTSSEYSIDDFDLLNSDNEYETWANTADVKNSEVFERAATGGSFHVGTDIYERDLPPMRIRDLRVTDMKPRGNGTLQVKITWTWPGAHLTSGKASFVQIRVGSDYRELISTFDEQTPITDADVLGGSLKPLPSGAKHVVNVSLPVAFSTLRTDGEFSYSALLAARVGNSDGLKSKISNVVSMYHVPNSAAPVVDRSGADWIWMWVVIALVVAGVLIAILVVVIRKAKLHKRDVYAIFVRKQRHVETDRV